MCFFLQPCNSCRTVGDCIFFFTDLLIYPLEYDRLLGCMNSKGRTSGSRTWRCGSAFASLLLDPWTGHGGVCPTHPWIAAHCHLRAEAGPPCSQCPSLPWEPNPRRGTRRGNLWSTGHAVHAVARISGYPLKRLLIWNLLLGVCSNFRL